MDRSNTVRASLAIVVIWLLGSMAGLIPDNTLQQSAPWMILGLFVLAAMLRLFALFWQTLAHAVQARSLGWVVGHFFFGPIASAAYYLGAKSPSGNNTRPPESFGDRAIRNRNAEQGGAPDAQPAPSSAGPQGSSSE